MLENNTSESTKNSLFDELWQPVMAFEANGLSSEEIAHWFSLLVSTGYIWKLPTSYVEHAINLLERGYIGNKHREMDS